MLVACGCRARVQGGLYRTKQGGIDYSHDFFSKAAYLTVSGQLQAEYYATALSNVYTFAPTFRAEGMPSFGPPITTLHSKEHSVCQLSHKPSPELHTLRGKSSRGYL